MNFDDDEEELLYAFNSEGFLAGTLESELFSMSAANGPLHHRRGLDTGYNETDEDDFTSNLAPAEDVSVDAVFTSIYLNAAAFVFLMLTYEMLRRLLPTVYSSRMKKKVKGGVVNECEDDLYQTRADPTPSDPIAKEREESLARLRKTLPDVVNSINWVSAVYGVSWNQVRRIAGLDGYFFLRFIRMNLRICAVTSFWAFAILVPVYATGKYQNNEVGWYHFSVANVKSDSWRMWVPSVFAYLFTGFIFFVMKQEYRHFLELRMDFLACGSYHVIPQQHYSIKVENIPYELRSEKALYDYFNKLFPGKVHSASVVLNLPDLEANKNRCLRVCRRLEKSIAHYLATGKRATHTVGSPRMNICGIDMAPFDWSCGGYKTAEFIDSQRETVRPGRGTHVDSISYYTHDLANNNKNMFSMQQRKTEIAISGNKSFEAGNWLSRAVSTAYRVADQIMVESAEDNGLRNFHEYYGSTSGMIPQAEQMTSRYGSFGPLANLTPKISQARLPLTRSESPIALHQQPSEGDIPQPSFSSEVAEGLEPPETTPSQKQLLEKSGLFRDDDYAIPGSTVHTSIPRRVAGRLGLDFVVAFFKFFNRQLDQALEGVVGATMSSTGFVTFLDLTSVACASRTPLTVKPQLLDVSVAPEPRDIVWANAHISARSRERREQTANILLTLGVFFWIFPLAAVQAFAKADYLAKIPGMEWILTFDGGSLNNFVNGYLPVVALLVLILILPVLFQQVALKYERRATYSDIQNSMLDRYFYYQVVNIYVTVTAGSIWKSLADILDHPSSLLELLGKSLPAMVGYFVALLVTKILAGLPIVFLRVGALSRLLFLRTLSSSKKFTQRELDEIYRPENVQYGWEFPSQLLVIMIVFSYAVICPIIVPVGLLYFAGSLLVYKKQVLYVYQSVYESGGAMFPSALQRTLFGLICGQCTLIGYFLIRGCYYQPIFLVPLPLASVWGMQYFRKHYADPSGTLSMERAREYDRVNEKLARRQLRPVPKDLVAPCSIGPRNVLNGIEGRRAQFDEAAYKQPVLTQKPMLPRSYRRGKTDPPTKACRDQLRELQDYTLMTDDEESAGGDKPNDEQLMT